MAFSAILFDCDGVLVDSEVVGLEDTADYLSRHGFAWTARDLVVRFTGKRMDLYRAELRREYERLLAGRATDEGFERLFTGIIEMRQAARHRIEVVPGAGASLAAAAASFAGRLAVASSSGQQTLDDKIDRFGLRPHFGPHVYSADHVAHGKPAPDIFLYAAERLGMSPEACLVIEDSPHGVAAGVAAGATVWGFTGGGHCLEDHGARLVDAGAAQVLSDHPSLTAELLKNRPKS